METKNATLTPPGVIAQILNTKAKYGFSPTTSFYQQVGIKRKRWAMLYRDEISPTLEELRAICTYFEANIKIELI